MLQVDSIWFLKHNSKIDRKSFFFRCSKSQLLFKMTIRLPRSCNRQDVRLLNNRILLPFHSELAGSDTERIKRV